MTALPALPITETVPPGGTGRRARPSRLRRIPPVHSPLSLGALRAAALEAVHRDARPRLARDLCRMYDADEALLVDSGTHALELALLLAERITRGTNVVALPAYCCFDVATAAAGAGTRVMLYDVDPDTLAPDVDSLETMLRTGARVAVVAPLHGMPVDWPGLEACAAKYGALLIEDAAQGFGASLRERPLGAHGRLSVLSFGRGKGWTGGLGGALLARGGVLDAIGPAHEFAPDTSPALGGFLRAAAQWAAGRPGIYTIPASLPWLHLGETRYHEPHPIRDMPRVAAGVLEESLSLALAEAAVRRRAGRAYREELAGTPRLAHDVHLVRGAAHGTPGYLRFPVRLSHGMAGLPDADGAERLGMARGFPSTLAELPAVRRRLRTVPGADRWPGAHALVQELATLPTHSYVGADDRAVLMHLVRAYHR